MMNIILNKNKTIFAKDLCLYKLILIFFICAVVGDFIETIFVWKTDGVLMNRSSLIYGPFSIVWGLGGVITTIYSYCFLKKNAIFIFIGGTVIGGVYEYFFSLFSEVIFGAVFWDYSYMPYNLNGRINLLFCLYWGLLTVIWVKAAYPIISKNIERIQPCIGKIVVYIMVVFLSIDMLISGLAMVRYMARRNGNPSQSMICRFLDSEYNDEIIEEVYPAMIISD